MRAPSPRKILKLAKTISEHHDSFSQENSFLELSKSAQQKLTAALFPIDLQRRRNAIKVSFNQIPNSNSLEEHREVDKSPQISIQ